MHKMQSAETDAVTLRPLITASEAYPELERLFLAAKSDIKASFRIFDPATKLHSSEAREIGGNWFDLICHTLGRGVRIDLTLTDFDPVFGLELHQKSWRTIRQLSAARECSDNAQLTMRVAMHPAQVGFLKRCMFWPVFHSRMKRHLDGLDEMSEAKRAFTLSISPGLARLRESTGRWGLPPAQFPATHHQKLVVVDGATLFIGGLDLNDRRFDDPEHHRPGDQTWHDVSVLSSGPHVADALAHLTSFWDPAVAPQPLRKRPKITFLRTLSRDSSKGAVKLAPHTELAEIEAAHLALFARAERLIYLESQFLRSAKIARALARAARRNPQLGLILILPAAPDDVAFENSGGMDARFGEFLQARAIRKVRHAFGYRAFIGMSVRPVRRNTDDRSSACKAELIYIHSKITIADDTQAIVSSANLNGRSMRWDTEAGLQIDEGTMVADLRNRLFRHWMPDDAEEKLFSLADAPAAWAALARKNASLPPEDRSGFIVPYDLRAAENFGRDVPFVPPEMV